MATIPQIAKVLPWLDKSGLKDTNLPLYQVIRALIQGQIQTGQVVSASSSSSGGITSLTTDVVAVGPGAAVATIQPGVVTYAKIQDTVGSDILIGRADTPGTVEEITLGDNLIMNGTVLSIETPDGTIGFAHPLLSLSHNDTIPYTPPVPGDMIVAFENVSPENVAHINGFILAPLVEDFEGIYAGMVLGMPDGLIPTYGGAYSAQPFDYITPVVADYEIRLVPEIIDAFILAPLVEDFIGIRAGYTALVPGGSEPGPGNYGAYSPPELAFIEPPSPTPEITALWSRISIGNPGQILRVIASTPSWFDPFKTVIVTDVGTVNNLDFTGATTVFLDNASLLTITGITVGPVSAAGTTGNQIPIQDGQSVTFISRGTGNVYFAHQNSGSTVGNRLTNFITSGVTPLAPGSGIATYQYDAAITSWRLINHTQGAWLTPTYAAGNFTGSGAMTWGVDEADILTSAYLVQGRTFYYNFAFGTTTVGGVVSTDLNIALPNSYISAKTVVGGVVRISDNGSVGNLGILVAGATGTNIIIRSTPLVVAANWTLSTNNTLVQGTFGIEIQ